jgi:hypothetical protein
MRIAGKVMEELWECEEREAMGMEEQEEWEEVEEDLEWGIRDRYSEEGGLIDWWMERWCNGKCQGDPPLFIIEGWAEIKWLSRGFWEMVETGEMIVLINGWSGEETRGEERRKEREELDHREIEEEEHRVMNRRRHLGGVNRGSDDEGEYLDEDCDDEEDEDYEDDEEDEDYYDEVGGRRERNIAKNV